MVCVNVVMTDVPVGEGSSSVATHKEGDRKLENEKWRERADDESDEEYFNASDRLRRQGLFLIESRHC